MTPARTARSGHAAVTVAGLTVRIPTTRHGRAAQVHAATDVALTLAGGSVHALVGESGCGKSLLCAALVGLLPPGTMARGDVVVAGQDVGGALAAPRAKVWDRLRGRVVGALAQSSATALTPTRTVGAQLAEAVAALGGRLTPAELLGEVGLDVAVLRLYPHELSGGMSARAALACALAGQPRILLADEPTAGLDPGLAARTLRLLRRCADDGAAVLLVTHDLSGLLDSGVADEVSVMYAGRILESGPAVLTGPGHAYTRALLAALPENGLHPLPGMPPSLTDLPADHDVADRLGLTRR